MSMNILVICLLSDSTRRVNFKKCELMALQTGVHGKVLSSDYGRPLSAFLSIKGINSSVCLWSVVQIIISELVCALICFTLLI